MSIGIYKYENKINGNIYIGQSVNIERRYKDHNTRAINDAESNPEYNSALHKAIRKYGIENFIFSILEECSVDVLDEREIYWIAFYNSYKNGYNETLGGSSPTYYKFDVEIIEKVKYYLLETSYIYEEISNKLNISLGMISEINNGLRYKDENLSYPLRQKEVLHCKKCGKELYEHNRTGLCQSCAQIKVELPQKLELAKMIIEKGFEEVGRQYGISGNAIKKRCMAYGIPHLKNELKQWYQKQLSSIKN
jgi:group I intron endonuclease